MNQGSCRVYVPKFYVVWTPHRSRNLSRSGWPGLESTLPICDTKAINNLTKVHKVIFCRAAKIDISKSIIVQASLVAC